jgi:hypothetical protein
LNGWRSQQEPTGLVKPWLCATRGTKINSFDLPLPSVSTEHASATIPAVLYPVDIARIVKIHATRAFSRDRHSIDVWITELGQRSKNM